MRTRCSLGLRSRKCTREEKPERLWLADRMLRGQRIHGVLHRVGRQDVAVVAVRVRLVVLALEPDRDGEILEVVAIAVARHLDEPDARFSVGSLSEHVSRSSHDYTDHTHDTRRNRREHQCSAKGHRHQWAPIITPHLDSAFTALADLASARVGGRAIAANDEFFAPKSSLLKAEPADFHPRQVHAARQVDGRLGDAPPPHTGPRLVRRRPRHARRDSRHQRRYEPLHRQLSVALLARGASTALARRRRRSAPRTRHGSRCCRSRRCAATATTSSPSPTTGPGRTSG